MNPIVNDADNAGFDVPESASASPVAPTQRAAPAPRVNVPPSVLETDDEDEAQPESLPVPKDFAEALEMVQAAEQMPTKTQAQERARAIALAHAQRHAFRFQQLPELPADAHTAMGHQLVKQVASLRRERMDILARQNQEVAEFLNAYDELVAEVIALRKQLSAAKG